MYLVKDQASRLRTLAKDLDVASRTALIYDETPRQIFDFMVVSGKHGVGKTTLVLSFAVALAQWGKRVLVVDMDFSSNTFPVYFDTIVEGGVYDFLKNDIELTDLIYSHASGVDFVANHVDLLTDFSFTKKHRTRLITSIDRIRERYDYIIADCAGGISQNTKLISELAKKLLCISTTDPISIIDSYSLVKYLYQERNKQAFEIIINQVSSEKLYKESVEKLDTAFGRFLNFNEKTYHKIEYSKLVMKRLHSQEISQDKDKYLLWAKHIRKTLKQIVS